MDHILKHFVNYGIGFRQIIDYYYLLQGSDAGEKKYEWTALFKEFGLLRMAESVMWVLCAVLGLDSKYLVTDLDEKRGRFLLDEMLECGNMGKYDQRLSGRLRRISPFCSKIIRNIKSGILFPYEVWGSPLEGKVRKFSKVLITNHTAVRQAI